MCVIITPLPALGKQMVIIGDVGSTEIWTAEWNQTKPH